MARLSWPGWLVIYWDRFSGTLSWTLDTVTHPSTNWARHRVTNVPTICCLCLSVVISVLCTSAHCSTSSLVLCSSQDIFSILLQMHISNASDLLISFHYCISNVPVHHMNIWSECCHSNFSTGRYFFRNWSSLNTNVDSLLQFVCSVYVAWDAEGAAASTWAGNEQWTTEADSSSQDGWNVGHAAAST